MSKTGAALKAAGWVTVGAVAAGGVAAAATTGGSSSPNPTATTASVTTVTPAVNTPNAGTPATKGPGGKGKHHRLAMLGARLLHGEATFEGKNNQPVTRATQRGTVNAVSTTSITVTSKDGFKQTYVVTPKTRVRIDGKKSSITDVHPLQTVGVVAKVDGQTETAGIIIERAGTTAG